MLGTLQHGDRLHLRQSVCHLTNLRYLHVILLCVSDSVMKKQHLINSLSKF